MLLDLSKNFYKVEIQEFFNIGIQLVYLGSIILIFTLYYYHRIVQSNFELIGLATK